MEVNVVAHQFKDLWSKTKKVLILMGGEPNADNVCAGLALADLLQSRGVVTHLISPEKLPQDLLVFYGAEDIKNDLESKNLIISFDYEKNPIEKVSYKIDGNTFNLIVKPRSGGIKLDDIQTSFVGGDYNLIIILGTADIKELRVYNSHPEIFESLPTINFDIEESNTRFGKLNIIDPKVGSISALLVLLLDEAGIKLPQKSSGLLLSGMRGATQNFTKVKSSVVFEAAALASRAKENKQEEADEGNNFKVNAAEEKDSDLPKDWLSPKVYRSSKVS